MNTASFFRLQSLLTLTAALATAGCADRAPSVANSTGSTPSPAPAVDPSNPGNVAAPPKPAPEQSRNPYQGLRDHALFSRVPLGSDRISGDPTVHAILVDWTISANATATLMCSADGSASIYTSTGGGVLGGGPHAEVRDAAAKLFQIVIELKSHLSRVVAPSLPGVNQMRFTLTTDAGLLSALANADDLKKGGHPLAPLANQVQVVINAIRTASAKKRNA